jgi:hypothetical protein
LESSPQPAAAASITHAHANKTHRFIDMTTLPSNTYSTVRPALYPCSSPGQSPWTRVSGVRGVQRSAWRIAPSALHGTLQDGTDRLVQTVECHVTLCRIQRSASDDDHAALTLELTTPNASRARSAD